MSNQSLLPRQKASKYGIESLSDSELVALLLDTGTRSEGVVNLSSRLLDERGGLRGVFLSEEQNLHIDGIKEGKAYRLAAVKEIMRRLPLRKTEKINTSKDAYFVSKNYFFNLKSEMLMILYLDFDNTLLRKDLFTDEREKSVLIPYQKIFKSCIQSKAKSVIMIHNHPSGKLSASTADLISVNDAFDKFLLIDVVLKDAIILNEQNYYSFRENKLGPYSLSLDEIKENMCNI